MESEDEDRKFFRAAAEAIVATSMNNPIDPTILELLRRIQYASLSKNQQTQNQSTESFLHQQLTQGHQQNSDLGLIDSRKAEHFPTFNLNYFGLGNSNNNGSNSSQNNASSTTTNTNTTSTKAQINHQLDGWKQQTSNTRSSLKTNSISDPGPKHSPLPNDTQRHTPNSHSDHTSASNTPSTMNPFGASNAQSVGSPDDGEPRPYACRDCTLSFRRSSDLRRHQRAHLPVLPHVCQSCGKGFARKDALKRHTDTLTCKRNRERLLSRGGDLEGILARANEGKRQRLNDMDEDDEDDDYNVKDEDGDY